MTMGMLLFAGGVAVVVGVLIGAIGIGGVLLVPMLTYVLGISIQHGCAASVYNVRALPPLMRQAPICKKLLPGTTPLS